MSALVLCHAVDTAMSDDLVMKVCARCKEAKALGEFYRNKNAKGGLTAYCKACSKAKANAWRLANQDRTKETSRAYRQANLSALQEKDRARYQADREPQLARMRKWRKANPDKSRAACDRWNSNNRERIRAAAVRRYWANVEATRERGRKYYAARREYFRTAVKRYRQGHIEEIRRRAKQYRDANRAKCQAQRARSYAKKREYYKAMARAWRLNNPEQYRANNGVCQDRRRARLMKCEGSHTGREWRLILKAHRYKCAECGTKDDITKDHIVPLALGGTNFAYNLQPLCKPCNFSKGARLPKSAQPSLYDGVSRLPEDTSVCKRCGEKPRHKGRRICLPCWCADRREARRARKAGQAVSRAA